MAFVRNAIRCYKVGCYNLSALFCGQYANNDCFPSFCLFKSRQGLNTISEMSADISRSIIQVGWVSFVENKWFKRDQKMHIRALLLLVLYTCVLSMFAACDDDMNPLSSYTPDNGNTGGIGIAVGTENTVAEARIYNSGDHQGSRDYIWDNDQVIPIVLNGSSITVDAADVTANGSIVTITSSGTYSISGSLDDGQIIVSTDDEETVRLILNGVYISSSTNSPIYVVEAKKTVIVLADNTENYVTDGTLYVYDNSDDNEPNAAIFSKDNLTIHGRGSLTVNGNFNDGIACKKGLLITSGKIKVNAVDDGIRGKDYLVVKDGNITVHAVGDGLKSNEDEDAALGFVDIETGVINITSGDEAITAATDVLIADGVLTLSSGGGSSNNNSGVSSKGIRASTCIVVDGGAITVDAADDGFYSNGTLTINGGSLSIYAGDDGIHADSSIVVNGGNINIIKSYEGIESNSVISINDGNIHITSSDDGINVAGGNDGSGMRGQSCDFSSSDNYHLYINGGYTVIDATGDGIDSNGSIVMTGGKAIVNGPTSNNNGALDYSTCKVTGGLLLAAGSAGMAQDPGTSSTQYSILLDFGSMQQAGTLVNIQTSRGTEILSFAPSKAFQSIAFSSPNLLKGSRYDVYYGGSSTGTVIDGLYQDGVYTPGSKYTSFTVSSAVTAVYR